MELKWIPCEYFISSDQGHNMTCHDIKKNWHDLCPVNLSQRFTGKPQMSRYGTRHRGYLQIPTTRLEYAKRSFYNSGLKNWNSFLESNQAKESIDFFRQAFTEYFFKRSTNSSLGTICIDIFIFFPLLTKNNLFLILLLS